MPKFKVGDHVVVNPGHPNEMHGVIGGISEEYYVDWDELPWKHPVGPYAARSLHPVPNPVQTPSPTAERQDLLREMARAEEAVIKAIRAKSAEDRIQAMENFMGTRPPVDGYLGDPDESDWVNEDRYNRIAYGFEDLSDLDQAVKSHRIKAGTAKAIKEYEAGESAARGTQAAIDNESKGK